MSIDAQTSASSRLIAAAESYFAAVDRKDLAGTLAWLAPDARFAVATYDTVFQGHEQISGMFERLFARYQGIWHGDFQHVVQPPDQLACQFHVRNTAFDGQVFRKNNCNFFRMGPDGRFVEVAVYMSGDNALR
jgi:ketosteroid isomerase-like protein